MQVNKEHDVFIREKEENIRPVPILVQVKSSNSFSRQHLTIVLQNGFLKLLVSLDSYNTEKVRSLLVTIVVT